MKFKLKIFVLNLAMILFIGNISYATEGTDFNMGKAILKLFFSTIIFIIVIIITIYGTRFIAKKSNKFINSKYMRIIDILNLSNNVKIIMVNINKKIYILAINNNTIEVIDKILEEEFEFKKSWDFEKDLDKYKNRYVYENDNISRFQSKINKFLNKSSKFMDKEDEDNEKKC